MAPDSIGKLTTLLRQYMGKVMTLLMQSIWKAVSPEDLKLGDHTYLYGLYGLYSHHGIYVGDGLVIHFTRTEDKRTICPSLSKTSHEQRSCPNLPEDDRHVTMTLGVVKTCVDCFRQDGNKLRSLYRYGYGRSRVGFMLARRGTCTTLPCTKSRDKVVETASRLHADCVFGCYHLLKNNCEHFALFCRTDIRRSEQTAFFSDCEQKIMAAKEWILSFLRRG